MSHKIGYVLFRDICTALTTINTENETLLPYLEENLELLYRVFFTAGALMAFKEKNDNDVKPPKSNKKCIKDRRV